MRILDRDLANVAFDYAQDIADNWDYSSKIYEDYSGRGMYGEKCFGIVASNPGVASVFLTILAAAKVEKNPEEFDAASDIHELAASMRLDNMGIDMIYYFPGWQLSEEENSASTE